MTASSGAIRRVCVRRRVVVRILASGLVSAVSGEKRRTHSVATTATMVSETEIKAISALPNPALNGQAHLTRHEKPSLLLQGWGTASERSPADDFGSEASKCRELCKR